MKVNQSIAPTKGTGMKVPFSQVIGSPQYQKMLETAISDPRERMKFVTMIMAAVTTTPKLKECDFDSIIAAGLQAQSLMLNTTTGDCWIIPYGDKATFQMGARGYVQLAMRSGSYQDIDTIEIREGEYKGRDKYTGKPIFEFIEDDDEREEKPVIGYLAYFTLLNGFHAQTYFSKTKMLKWANRYSQAFDIDLYNKYEHYRETGEGMTDKELRACSSPWYETFDSMAAKTVLKNLLSKRGILSTELVTAFQSDKTDGTTDGMFEFPAEQNAKQETPVQEEIVVEKVEAQENVQDNVQDKPKAEEAAHAVAEEQKPKRGRKKAEQAKQVEGFDFFDDPDSAF